MSRSVGSYREANARQRVARMFDHATGDISSFQEILPPSARVVSPHLAQLNAPVAFDDGVIIGRARLGGQAVLVAAQEAGFMGGAVGEVHGAKLTGLLQLALQESVEPVAAVVLLLDSGGVRLHEANAGLIAVSEVMRALLQVRCAGIPVVVLIGGSNGCFGGAGIIARCANAIIMSEEGRLAMSGPEVIESAHGVEEYDASDRALVWRTTGGKHRYLLGDCEVLVADDIGAFRQAAIDAIAHLTGSENDSDSGLSLAGMEAEHAHLQARLDRFGGLTDSTEIWRAMGIPNPESLPLLEVDAFLSVATAAAAQHQRGAA
jgi:malonate decarboxylase beta subunit